MRSSMDFGNETNKKNYGMKKRSAIERARREELRSLSDEDLMKACQEKAPNGCLTAYANEACKVLYNRRHYGC